MRFHSTNDIEDYIRDIIGIPYVNLEGMDIEVCNELLDTLKKAFSLYPLLKKSLVTIGQREDIVNQINLFIASNGDKWKIADWNDACSYPGFMSITGVVSENGLTPPYIALALLERVKDYNLFQQNAKIAWEVINGIHPEHCFTFKSTIWHELGHLLDNILRITKNKEFLELLRNIDIEQEISRYATKNEREAFAEAFAEYHSTNEPNEAVTKIVEFGLAEYQRRADKKSEMFDVSRKFR